MRNRLTVLLVSLLVLSAMVVTVSAQGWTKMVTGGCSYTTNYGEFTVTLSAWQRGETFGGQGQYYYPPLDRAFHLEVEQVCFAEDLSWAVAIGPVRGQDGTEVTGEGFGAIAIKEGGDQPDRFRVAFDKSEAFVQEWCENGAEGTFPAIVQDGNFNIREK